MSRSNGLMLELKTDKSNFVKTKGPTPVISIGMPVYNGEKNIKEALDSLLSQTFKDFELIISDNASTDATESICMEYANRDKRIRYIRQAQNNGALINFNLVLELASGEYFMWAASDDVWSKDWVEKLITNFTDQTAISFGSTVMTDENLKIIKKHHRYEYSSSRALRLARYFLTEERGKGNPIYGVMKTDVIRPLGFIKFNKCPLRFGQDFHMCFKLLEGGALRVDESVVLYKRERTRSNRRNSITLLSLPFEIFKDLAKSMVGVTRLRYYLTYCLIPQHFSDRVIIASLLPVKIVFGVLSQVSYFFQHARPVLQQVLNYRMDG